ncbi:MAG: glycerol-3-phosphate 1-O-acyltransferase PlsY [Proteobacteria bacterium]|nr:glycerol-3-phosphate 1-O-acyltransferase PlsY [Pseudomonadota bacterium]
MSYFPGFIAEITNTSGWLPAMLLAYFLGAIPFGFVIAKFFLGYDIRTQGSGNIGMTNVMRTGGKLPGIITFLLDFGKGGLSVLAAKTLFEAPPSLVMVVAFLSVFGHSKSLFLKFSGGKGVATNFGVWLILDWRVFLIITLTWLLVFIITRISSLSAIISLVFLPVTTIFFYGLSGMFVLAVILFFYIIFLHKNNIERLVKGEEKLLKSSN